MNERHVKLPPSDNPRRKQWEHFFNGTQESLDYINRMTECCDKLDIKGKEFLKKRAVQWKAKQK